jgi:hypothetical protein
LPGLVVVSHHTSKERRNATRLDQTARLKQLELRSEQAFFGTASEQAGPELAEHGVIEAPIAQFEAHRVLPIDAAADSVGSLAISQAFGELQDGHQGQPAGGAAG